MLFSTPMPERFRAPRGVADILPADQPYWRWLVETATRVARSYGYGQIDTPVFESTGVFLRPGSEGTDIADKEIYAFKDRGGDELALRTDGTHGVARAYIEHGMASLAAAGATLLRRLRVPLRPSPGRALPRAPPVRRRSDRRRRAGCGRRGHRRPAHLPRSPGAERPQPAAQ